MGLGIVAFKPSLLRKAKGLQGLWELGFQGLSLSAEFVRTHFVHLMHGGLLCV